MKIIINKIKIFIPNRLISSKLIWKAITKNNPCFDEKENPIDCKTVKKIKKELLRYVKKNGHFTFLEVNGRNDNENIKIIF